MIATVGCLLIEREERKRRQNGKIVGNSIFIKKYIVFQLTALFF